MTVINHLARSAFSMLGHSHFAKGNRRTKRQHEKRSDANCCGSYEMRSLSRNRRRKCGEMRHRLPLKIATRKTCVKWLNVRGGLEQVWNERLDAHFANDAIHIRPLMRKASAKRLV